MVILLWCLWGLLILSDTCLWGLLAVSGAELFTPLNSAEDVRLGHGIVCSGGRGQCVLLGTACTSIHQAPSHFQAILLSLTPDDAERKCCVLALWQDPPVSTAGAELQRSS